MSEIEGLAEELDELIERNEQLERVLENAHAWFGDIQTLNTHGMSNESYIAALRSIARKGQWELKVVLTAAPKGPAQVEVL